MQQQSETYDMVVRETKPLTAVQIRAQVNLIQEVMQAVMKKDVHYGIIPGTPKPTLYKAGAEKILSTFKIGVNPEADDLSTSDEVRYRVKANGFDQQSGALLGVGVGECSSSEEKYKWRRPVCDEEFNEAPEDRKRVIWKRGSGNNPNYQQKQIRTNPADVANTILKMAKKRAQIDLTLTVTAASDVFDQDLEDLPEEMRQEAAEQKPPIQAPQKKEKANGEQKATSEASNTVTVAVKNIFQKPGEKNGKKFVKYTIVDASDVRYGTFSDTIATEAKKAQESGAKVKIGFNVGQYGNDIVTLEIEVPEEGQ